MDNDGCEDLGLMIMSVLSLGLVYPQRELLSPRSLPFCLQVQGSVFTDISRQEKEKLSRILTGQCEGGTQPGSLRVEVGKG